MVVSPLDIFFGIIVLILFATSRILTNAIEGLTRSDDDDTEPIREVKLFRKGITIAFLCVILLFAIYHFTRLAHLESHVMEWLNLVIRWAHVVLGIAWIGA